jgi:hypothetical protein
MPLDDDRGGPQAAPDAGAARRVLSAIDHLLRGVDTSSSGAGHPASTVPPPPPSLPAPALLVLAAICLALYGASAGFYQGGVDAVLLAALKTPLIVLGALALCVPSLYVFATLAGGRLDAGSMGSVLAGFAALIGVVLVALIPVSWLFSVGSRGLWFLVVLHLLAWVVAASLAARSVQRLVALRGSSMSVTPWVVLLLVVTLQMTTHLRPVLWRPPAGPLFQGGKLSFLEHYAQVLKDDSRGR